MAIMKATVLTEAHRDWSMRSLAIVLGTLRCVSTRGDEDGGGWESFSAEEVEAASTPAGEGVRVCPGSRDSMYSCL